MRKLLIGFIIVAVLAVAGYFGVTLYAQHRASQEVAAAFAAMRADGISATHGAPSFDLWTRTLTVPDVALASATEPPATLKIGRIVASGLSHPAAGQFSAQRIEVSDAEAAFTLTFQSAMALSYKAPLIVFDGYSGQAAPVRPVDTSSAADMMRFWGEHFTAMRLTSVSIPTLTLHLQPGPANSLPALGSSTYVYTGVAMHDLHDGRLGSSTIERMTAKTAIPSPSPASFAVEMADVAALDFDANALLAIFDPAEAKDDTYHRVYRHITIGTYKARIEPSGPPAPTAIEATIGSLTVDDVGLRPSKLRLPGDLALIRTMLSAGTPPSPAAAKAMSDQLARIYEGIGIGRIEVSGVDITVPQKGAVRLAALRVSDFTAGKIGEFAIEGIEAPSPTGPVKVGRFALKSFAIADLMRTSAAFGSQGAKPSPEQLIGLLRLLESVEVRGVVAPYKTTGETVTIDTLDASWGQFVGVVPTAAHLATKVASPIVANDPAVYQLLGNSGIKSLTSSLDLGAAWDEKAATFSLAPASLEFGELLAGSARASLANVSRDVFAIAPMQRAIATAAVQVGAIEITIRDLGGVDILLRKLAADQNISLDDARKQVINQVREGVAELAAANPDVPAATDAAADFIASSHATLTLRINPKTNVSLLAFIADLQQNPAEALGAFRIEATTTH